jgi:uncharacterized protein (DUF885 family)
MPRASPDEAVTRAAISLDRLEDEFLRCYYAARPFEARQLGIEYAHTLLPLIVQEEIDELEGRLVRIQRQLKDLDHSRLSEDERLGCQLMEEMTGYELSRLAAAPQRYVVSPLPEAGLASQLLVLLPHSSLGTPEACDALGEACRAVPPLLDKSLAALSEGRSRGQTPVRHLVLRAIGQVQQYLSLSLEDDPYCLAARRTPGDGGGRAEELSALVESEIRPAFHHYVGRLREDVLPLARPVDRVGLSWIPEGEEYYSEAVRRYTTLDLTPSSIHEIGLSLVEQLRREMEQAGAEAGLRGDFVGLCAQMRDDPALYYEDGAQLLGSARHVLAAAQAVVPRWITEPPAVGCEVREMDPLEARNGVLGKYQSAPLDRSRPAYYWLNTANPRKRPIYETAVLTHHESVPGHHLESAKTLEAAKASQLRRLLRVLPFYEGWCLYMERFADELGLYEEPFSRLGMFSFALWRSCRLVVDTGIHEFGWSRGKAVRYMWENTALTRRNITNEVDRYIAHPGSAVGYMVGCLAIREIRHQLDVNCTDSVASRTFHTDLLRHGQLTLSRLAETMGVSTPLRIGELAA